MFIRRFVLKPNPAVVYWPEKNKMCRIGSNIIKHYVLPVDIICLETVKICGEGILLRTVAQLRIKKI